MFWIKSCPKCHGDLNESTDIYGNYISCFQCGHYLTAVEETSVRDENPLGKHHALPEDEPVRILTEIAA